MTVPRHGLFAWVLMLLPAAAQATCYPIYGDTNLSLGNNATINGVSVSSTSTSDTAISNYGQSTTVYPTLTPLSPSSFPVFCTGTCPSTTAYTIAAGSYNQVSATSKTTPYNFTGGTYYIKTLILDNDVTANFAAGDYFVQNFDIGNDVVINISSGPVRFFIGQSVEAGNKTSMNGGGVAANLQFLLYPGASLQFGNQDQANSNIDFSGIIYAPYSNTSIQLGNNVDYQGTLIGAGTVSAGNGLDLTYDATVSAVLEPAGQCVPEPAPPVYGRFNAVDLGDNRLTGSIKTKIAGANFSPVLEIVAINETRTAVETSFGGTVKVELLVADNGLPDDIFTGCRSTWTPVIQTANATLTSGVGTIVFNQANAWPNVRVRVSYPATGTPTRVACSGDNLAIRPNSLSIAASDATWETAGTTRALNVITASGTPVHKAGRPFTLTITARNAANVITSNYAGAPTSSTLTCVLPASCVFGTLNTGSFSGSGGTVVSNTASYDEVGAVGLALKDTTYAAVDNDDSSPTQRDIPTLVPANVGRFVPDHFALTAGTLIDRAGINTGATETCASDFTYLGEEFKTLFGITAQNAANGTTQNYAGSLAKLATAAWSDYGFSAANLPAGSALAAGATAPTAGWVGGIGSVTAWHQASRPVTPVAGTTDVVVSAQPTDSDGVTMAAPASVHAGTTALRYGRLRLANATGSELLALPVAASVQHWDGAGFVTHASDACTTVPALATAIQTSPLSPGLTFYPASPSNQLSAGETTPTSNPPLIAGGVFPLVLSSPGAGNFGYLDLVLDAPAWLKYNWDGVDQGGDGNWLDDNPSARVAFGKRRLRDRVIIRRETY